MKRKFNYLLCTFFIMGQLNITVSAEDKADPELFFNESSETTEAEEYSFEFDKYNIEPNFSDQEEIYGVYRIGGRTRYETAMYASSFLNEYIGLFQNVVVASGQNYPDALSGGYFSASKNAPIMLINEQQEDYVLSGIRQFMIPGGTVYLLGGSSVIRNSFESKLKAEGVQTVRLYGKDRYETNLEILKDCYQKGDELLVAQGGNFPDSLSGSSVGKPMLLVSDSLSTEQKEWIDEMGVSGFVILGGENAVSRNIEEELAQFGEVERIAGKDRWETSYLIAKRFNPEADAVTLATGLSFPDALSGAPLSTGFGAPIILVSEQNWKLARNYMTENKIKDAIVMGGPSVVNYVTVDRIFFGDNKYKSLSSLGINVDAVLNARIDEQLEMLEGHLLEGGLPGSINSMPDYDKAFMVLNYVGANYNYGDAYTAKGMLDTGSGTCFAYSELVYYMLKKLSVTCWLTIPGRHIDGTYGGEYRMYGSQHRSVVALIDGKYYDVDGQYGNLSMMFGILAEPAELDTAYAEYLIGKRNSF